MGNLEATVRAIVARGEQASREATLSGNKAPSGIQVVAVCGRNAQLAKELNGADWLPRGARVLATGFVDNMEEWMGAADVIVTKAGEGVSRAWRDESRLEKPPRGKKRGEENSLFSPPFSKNQKPKKRTTQARAPSPRPSSRASRCSSTASSPVRSTATWPT